MNGSHETAQEEFTPYAAAKKVNEVLAAVGVSKTLPPQMFYNYTKGRAKQGKAPFIPFNEETGKISGEALKAWTIKYLAKQGVVLQESETVDETVDEASVAIEA